MAQRKLAQTPLVCHGHTRPIVQLAYSPITPDGYFLVSASKDGQPMLRNGETGDWVGTFSGHKGAVWSCVLNDTALLAATASADFSVKIWDALSGDEKHMFQHKHIMRTVQFARDGIHVVSGGYEKLLRVYNLERPDAEPLVLEGAKDAIHSASWHQNDKLILCSLSNSPGIMVWDVRSGAAVQTLEAGKSASIEVQRDESVITLASGSDVTFWDGTRLDLIKSYQVPYVVESATFCPKKGRFAAGGEDMWVHLFDYATGEQVECNKGHHGPVHSVQFSPTGEHYASGSEDGTLRIWKTDFLLENGNGVAENGVNGGAGVQAAS